MYHFACRCGRILEVSGAQAGSPIVCGTCGEQQLVPRLSLLKRLAGDAKPYLAPIDKVRQAIAERVPPFDGRCHRCDNVSATVCIHVEVSRLIDDYPTIENWETVSIPLGLCSRCRRHLAWPWLFREFVPRVASLAIVAEIALSLMGFLFIDNAYLFIAYFLLFLIFICTVPLEPPAAAVIRKIAVVKDWLVNDKARFEVGASEPVHACKSPVTSPA